MNENCLKKEERNDQRDQTLITFDDGLGVKKV